MTSFRSGSLSGTCFSFLLYSDISRSKLLGVSHGDIDAFLHILSCLHDALNLFRGFLHPTFVPCVEETENKIRNITDRISGFERKIIGVSESGQ